MFKAIHRVSFALAAIVATSAAAVGFAQNDEATPANSKRPLSVRSIRPLTRSEVPANKAPNLDRSSDEFSYFRDELGRSETSTKTKKRLQELENRVVYVDPMDKPAWDGSPFVDIYSDIYIETEPFVDPDDPDEIYKDDENNILAKTIEFLDVASAALTLATGIGPSTGNNANQYDAYGSSSSSMMAPPSMPMPDAGDGKIMVSVGGVPGSAGVSSGSSGKTQKEEKPVGPSEADDSKLIVLEEVENPFKAEAQPIPEDLDLFKADREFKAKPQTNNSGNATSGYPSYGLSR